MTSQLLAVKFFIPRPRPGLTARPQLIDRFESGLERPLTLISAPAGFGKSTLLGICLEHLRAAQPASHPRFDIAAWLSLDAAENGPLRFWTYFVAALQAAQPNPSRQAGQAAQALPFEPWLDLLQADPPPLILPVLDALINQLSLSPERILCVLDDYHQIQSPLIHEQVAYLLDHQPPNLHLVIATRADPPLPISRLRARGHLSEIRSADLRFNRVETAQLMKNMTGLDVAAEDVAAIETSTEGWVAGLQMAALALQAQFPARLALDPPHDLLQGVHDFIVSFSGKHVYILDYLADEVFNRQPEAVQAFLLKTSILDRMCTGLCDALIDPPPGASSQSILEYLNRSNLFLIPLDAERQWYRYHHLFADLLRARLDQALPGQKPGLHVRASDWFERSGAIEEAINHALTAQDWERAARLMEQHIQAFLERGQLSKVMDWTARLPKEVAGCRPRLSIQQAWVMGFAQRMKEFVPLLENADRCMAALEQEPAPGSPTGLQEIVSLKANLMVLKGYHAIMLGDPQQALALARQGLEDLPPGLPWEKSWLEWLSGYAYRSLSRLDQAAAAFREALRVSQEQENLWNDMICCTDLAMVFHLQGRLAEARSLYLQALELGRVRRAATHGYLNRVEAGLSAVLLDCSELDKAAHHGETALELSQWWPSANSRALALTSLGRVRLAKGDLVGAAQVIQQAEQERRKWPLLPINDSLVDYALVRLWLAQADLPAAAQWAKTFQDTAGDGLQPGQVLNESLEMKTLALVRVRLAQGRTQPDLAALDQALALLDVLEPSAQAGGRIRSQVEAAVLRSLVLLARSQRPDSAALTALQAALTLAQPGGIVRVFIDEGTALVNLLQSLRGRSAAAASSQFLDRLLALLKDPSPGSNSGAAGDPRPGAALAEPLTARELEVLRLMARGLSNREMAQQLVLSEGTIKTHVHNLIGKLDAQSRTHVLARAKELGLL
jgi:LuxR family transcriptional regulator, maltose regulon positive regulatory protein